MKRAVFAVFAAALALLAGSVTFAQTNTIASVGFWKAFAGKSNNGKALCGMSSEGKAIFFSIKVYQGNDEMTVQLSAKSWKINDGAKQKTVMRFDRASPWNATATGFHFSDGDAGLEFVVALKNLEKFLTEFAASNTLRISFDGSDAQNWTLVLTGTAAVTSAFSDCVIKRL